MSKIKPDVKLLHTIISDDLRREDNGKFFLIGVYPEAIVMNVMPAQIPLSIWMQFQVHLKKKLTLDFELKGDPLEETISFPVDVGDEKVFGKDAVMPVIMQLPIKIVSTGNIAVSYKKSNEKKWNLAKNIRIKSMAKQDDVKKD